MKLLQVFLYSLLLLLAGAYAALSAELPSGVAPEGKDNPGHFYADQYLTLLTPDFHGETWGYGLGLGYQVNPYWGGDVRFSHEGLDADGSLVQGVGVRLTARMPFKFLSPYGFLGGTFGLERDVWAIQPGAGIEITPSKSLSRLAVFLEGQLNADVNGRNTYGFNSGLRWRF